MSYLDYIFHIEIKEDIEKIEQIDKEEDLIKVFSRVVAVGNHTRKVLFDYEENNYLTGDVEPGLLLIDIPLGTWIDPI